MDYDYLSKPVEGLLSTNASYDGVAWTLRVLEGVQILQSIQVHVQEVESLGGVDQEEAWRARCEQSQREQGAEGEWERGQSNHGISVKEVETRFTSNQHRKNIAHLH
jgi:hypothetical protein